MTGSEPEPTDRGRPRSLQTAVTARTGAPCPACSGCSASVGSSCPRTAGVSHAPRLRPIPVGPGRVRASRLARDDPFRGFAAFVPGGISVGRRRRPVPADRRRGGGVQGDRIAAKASLRRRSAKRRVAEAMPSEPVLWRMTASARLVAVALFPGAKPVRARHASSPKTVSRTWRLASTARVSAVPGEELLRGGALRRRGGDAAGVPAGGLSGAVAARVGALAGDPTPGATTGARSSSWARCPASATTWRPRRS